MIKLRVKLDFLVDKNGVLTDYTKQVSSFTKETLTIDLESTDKIWIGYHKKINQVYFNLLSVLQNSQSISEFDETNGLQHSGFIYFDEHIKQSINNKTQYWYCITGLTRVNLQLAGCNLLLSDDNSLILEQPLISQPQFLGDEKSFIKLHVSAREEVLRRLSRKFRGDFDVFDIFEIPEARLAALYLVMSKIYFNFSDSNSDSWMEKSSYYHKQYVEIMASIPMTSDDDGDGELEVEEVKFDGWTMDR